jgi:glyoxylase-like metal-dependent hydrolase (beta-lactamase superfamily II)
MAASKAYASRHFQLEQLADGVYAAINSEEGWAICNAGIIDLGDRTLVYDAFTSPQAAKDLRQAAEQLTGRPVSMVINSHYHNDHIWGNQAFNPATEIISTAKTRQLIITEGIAEVKGYSETAPARLEALEKQLAEAGDETIRRQLNPMIFDYQAIVAALPILKVRPPTLTFDREMSFYGSKRSGRLIAYENAHCGSDAILYLPDDGIIFTEDILFIGCHPYLAEGDPEVIQRILLDIKNLQPAVVVPGHGPVGSRQHLDIQYDYINCLKNIAKDAIKQGIPEEELARVPIPAEYQDYIFSIFFISNLQSQYKRVLGR